MVTATTRAFPNEPFHGQADLHLSARRSGHAHRDGALRAGQSRPQAAARQHGHRHAASLAARTCRCSPALPAIPSVHEMLAQGPRAGRARKRGHRHRQPDDRLSRDVAGRVRRRRGRARPADDRARTACRSYPVLERTGSRATASSPAVRSWSMPRRGSTRRPVRSTSAAAAAPSRAVERHDRSPIDARRSRRQDRGGAGQALAGGSHAGRAATVLPGPAGQPAGLDGRAGQADRSTARPVFLCCAGCKKRPWPIRRRRWPKSKSSSSKTAGDARDRPAPNDRRPRQATSESRPTQRPRSSGAGQTVASTIASWPSRNGSAPVLDDSRLGSMGPPDQAHDRRPAGVPLLRQAAEARALADPQATLATAKQLAADATARANGSSP